MNSFITLNQFYMVLLFCCCSLSNLHAQRSGPSRFLIDPVSRLQIHGKSNVNKFTCTCRQSFLELPFSLTAHHEESKLGFRHTVLNVQTRLFDCGNKVMNEDMYHALKSKKYPQMSIELDAVERIAQIGPTWTDIKVWTKITLAGEARDVWLPAKIRQPGPGRWHIRTKKVLRMTDFKVTPPTALMGMIKTDDEITIELDLLIHWLPCPY